MQEVIGPRDRNNNKDLNPCLLSDHQSKYWFSFSFLSFFALYFPSQYQWLLPFLILEIKNISVQSHYTTRTEPRVVRSTKLSPVLRDSCLDGWPKTNTPRGNNFIFFFIPFRRRYLRLQTYPALCDVASSISQLFVPHLHTYIHTYFIPEAY